jgi:6-bladed beta-propeller
MRTHPRLRAAALAAFLLAPAAAASAQQAVRLPAADRALAARPAAVFTLAAGEHFTDASGVAFDRDGRLYVLDRQAARVAVFDAQGRFVRVFGRRGRGEGGMVAPLRVAVTPDGRVVIPDLAQRAFLVFSADGAFRGSVPFPVRNGLVGRVLLGHPAGGVISTVQQVAGMGGDGGVENNTLAVVLQPLDGGRASTLFRVEEEGGDPHGGGSRGGAPPAAVSVNGPAVFSPRLHAAVFPSGAVAVAHTAGYRVAVSAPGRAGAVRVIERAIQPRRVSEDDRRRARELRVAEAGAGGVVIVGGPNGGGPSREALAAQARNLAFADVVPVIEGLGVDGEGRLWISRAAPRVGDPGPIDLVSEQGAYLGTLRGLALPAAFGPGRAAWIERDGDGPARVVVRSVPREWR